MKCGSLKYDSSEEPFFPIFQYNRFEITSPVFRLNYGATALILMAASLTVTVKQFGGRPIECAVGKELAGDVVNNYCWIHSSYTTWNLNETHTLRKIRQVKDDSSHRVPILSHNVTPRSYVGKRFTRNMLMARYGPALISDSGPYYGIQPTTEKSVIRYHKYYQWVAAILLCQVGCLLIFF